MYLSQTEQTEQTQPKKSWFENLMGGIEKGIDLIGGIHNKYNYYFNQQKQPDVSTPPPIIIEQKPIDLSQLVIPISIISGIFILITLFSKTKK